ncbi:MAG: hypothetical protein KAX13_05590 [Candidatus Krumholzibacteria bacterium]|nr:hypothetical protein [Candidatus Krumholzibacteria bacterium]
MRTVNHKAYACIVLLATVLLAAGCGDEGSPVTPEEDTAVFKTLTIPENLIYNLVLSYDELNIEEYAKLLLNTYDGDYGQEYCWYNQTEDAGNLGEVSYRRDEEIERTGNMFQAAKGTPVKPEHPIIDELEFVIYNETRTAVDSLWGEPCEDCWMTERGYFIKIRIGDDSIYGDDKVFFYVVPVQEGDVTTYRIALAIDVRE